MPGGKAQASFTIDRLTLTDFRNYRSLRLDCPHGLIVLVGQNGAGKTNLLEAISMLAPGRGLRGAEAQSMGRFGGGGSWAVSARAGSAAGDMQVGTAWAPSEDEGQAAPRAVLIDGRLQRSSAALAQHLRIAWLTPAQDRLFAGPSADRRRYFDRMVALFDVEHGTRVAGFEKLMRERNILLQEGPGDLAWLSSLEAQMAEHAVAIAAARLYSAQRLNVHLAADRLPAPFPWGHLTLEGEIEDQVTSLPALSAEEAYRQRLKEGRSLDRAAGRTLTGPHRSDFMIVHGPKGVPASEGSTGEQKALLIGLLLAQVETIREAAGAAPILLLDEISAHLDRARKTALFGLLGNMSVQAWMTGTEVEVFDGAGPSTVVYQVDHGTLHESKF